MPSKSYTKLAFTLTFAFSLAFFSLVTPARAQDKATGFIVADEDTIELATDATAQASDEATSDKPQDPALAEKFNLANKILKINPVEQDLNDAIDALADQVPANRRILFKSIIDRSIKIDRLNAAAQLAFVEVFTKEELQAMHDYYASEEGVSIQKKMPEFEERIQPVIKSMVEDAVFNIKNSNVDFSKK